MSAYACISVDSTGGIYTAYAAKAFSAVESGGIHSALGWGLDDKPPRIDKITLPSSWWTRTGLTPRHYNQVIDLWFDDDGIDKPKNLLINTLVGVLVPEWKDQVVLHGSVAIFSAEDEITGSTHLLNPPTFTAFHKMLRINAETLGEMMDRRTNAKMEADIVAYLEEQA